ncbi:MAG: ABC transporter ATP-binding protein [Myxococcales bacterium]|nr:ABC transporter ATP-binding protein [Myxococcales bacterium]
MPPPAAAELGTARFEPVAEAPRYPRPKASVHADTERGWMRRLLPVALARKLLLTSAISSAIVGLLAGVSAPAVLGFAFNDVLARSPLPATGLRAYLVWPVEWLGLQALRPDGGLTLQAYVTVLASLGIARAIAMGYYRYGLYRSAYHIETDLRSIIYEHLTRLSFSFYDRVQTGQIVSRANSDIRAVQIFLTFAPLMVMTWLSFGLALWFMLSVHVGLSIATIAALPGVYLLGSRMRKQMFPLSWLSQSRAAELSVVVEENISGVRVVKSFAAEQRQLDALARAAQRVFWTACEMVQLRAVHGPLMENVARLGPAILLLYGGYLVIEGHIEGVGTLVTFSTYMIMLQAPFRVLGFYLTMSQRAAASAHRIFEILDEPVEVRDKPDAIELPSPRGEIEFADVRFGYAGGPTILDGFSLRVAPGETVALVGRTGSGKSTAARLLARFYDVDDGAIRIDGHDVRDVGLLSLRARVGLSLDEPFLFSMSVRDNIAYGRPEASLDDVIAAARAAQAHGFIEQLAEGYNTVVGERGYTLSGGQRQRISLARLFLLNPPILVLDDATSAVDVEVEAKIHGALHDLLSDRTTLVIAHRESTIGLADRVALLEQGRVVATGTHAELLASEPRYRAVLAQGHRSLPPEEAGKTAGRARAVRRPVGGVDGLPGGGLPPGFDGGLGP